MVSKTTSRSYIYLKMLVKAVVDDQTVRHANAMWLHWMSRSVGVVTDFI